MMGRAALTSSLAWLGALALTLAAACPAWAQGRPERQVPRLSVNSSMAFRQSVAQSEAQGIAQMRAMLPQADYEEIWAFLPAEQRWLELGCCERQTRRGNYVGLDGEVLRLMAAHDRLAIYHIHTPSHFIRENYNQGKRLLKTVEEALPSAMDMATMIKLSRQHRRLHPRGQMIWRIVSRHGVTTYGLTARALDGQDELGLKPFYFSPLEEEELTEPGSSLVPLIELALRRLAQEPFVLGFERLP